MKRVIDVDLIKREIDRYSFPSPSIGEEFSIGDCKLQHLCLLLQDIINNSSVPVETYHSSYVINNPFVGKMNEDKQKDFKEYINRELYYQLCKHLCEENCGNTVISEIDKLTEQFTISINLTVLKNNSEDMKR